MKKYLTSTSPACLLCCETHTSCRRRPYFRRPTHIIQLHAYLGGGAGLEEGLPRRQLATLHDALQVSRRPVRVHRVREQRLCINVSMTCSNMYELVHRSRGDWLPCRPCRLLGAACITGEGGARTGPTTNRRGNCAMRDLHIGGVNRAGRGHLRLLQVAAQYVCQRHGLLVQLAQPLVRRHLRRDKQVNALD